MRHLRWASALAVVFVFTAVVAPAPLAVEQAAARAAAQASGSAPLRAVAEDAQRFQRERPPAMPLPAGVDKRYSARMPLVSEAYVQGRAAKAEALLNQLNAIDVATLTMAEQLDAFIIRDRLQQVIADARFKTYLVPLSDAGGFHVQFASDLNTRAFATASDYDEYVARLQSFKDYTAAADRDAAAGTRRRQHAAWSVDGAQLHPDGHAIRQRDAGRQPVHGPDQEDSRKHRRRRPRTDSA